MTDLLDRLKCALSDRYSIERELGSLNPKVVCDVSQNGVESPYSKAGVIGDCDVVGTSLMRRESNHHRRYVASLMLVALSFART